MKILLLDDKKERTQDIEQIANEYNFELITSHSLEDAENKLKRNQYGIIIVDLVVPSKYSSRELSKNAGFELIKYIFETNDELYTPHGVVVVSDNLNDIEYADDLNLYPVSVIDTNFECWQNNLRMVINNLLLRVKPVDIAIITAIEPEFNAIYKCKDWQIDLKVGSLVFYRTIFETKSKKEVTAILAQTEDKGMVPTGLLMSKLFENYNPTEVFLIGVSAGNPAKTSFGDIIIATSSCDYSRGAITDDENGELSFETEANLVKASSKLINVFTRYSRDSTLAFRIRKAVDMSTYNTDINIKLGLMACGPMVVKSKKVTEKYIKPYNKNYLGIDMESYAFYSFCENNDCEGFIAIKSVSDHGDREKGHEHQEYCSKLTVELLKHYIYNEL